MRPVLVDRTEPSHGHWKNVSIPLCNEEDSNINLWELVPIWMALKCYAHGFRNMHIVAFSDNLQVLHAVNKGTSANESSMNLLCYIFWECVKYNVYLSACYIPGSLNIIPEILSRVSNNKYVQLLNNFDLCCRYSSACRD